MRDVVAGDTVAEFTPESSSPITSAVSIFIEQVCPVSTPGWNRALYRARLTAAAAPIVQMPSEGSRRSRSPAAFAR